MITEQEFFALFKKAVIAAKPTYHKWKMIRLVLADTWPFFYYAKKFWVCTGSESKDRQDLMMKWSQFECLDAEHFECEGWYFNPPDGDLTLKQTIKMCWIIITA